MPSGEESRKVAERLFAAMAGDASVDYMDLLADDLEYWVAGDTPLSGTHSKADLPRLMMKMGAFFPGGLRQKATGMTAEGDRVAVEAVGEGITATGKVYGNRYHYLLEIDGSGKIRRMREYMDTGHVADILKDFSTRG